MDRGYVLLFNHRFCWNRFLIVFFTYHLVRILLFSIDPHSMYGILPIQVSGVLFDIPVVLWLAGAFLMALYW